MAAFGKALLLFALVFAIAGGVLLLLARTGIHRLPGDVVIRRKHVTVYMPLGLMLVVSLLLTVALNLSSRR